MWTRGTAEREIHEVQLTGLKKKSRSQKVFSHFDESIHATHILFTFERKFGIPLGAL